MIRAKYTVVLKSLMDDPNTMEAINKAMSTYPLYEKKSKEEYIPSYIPTRDELNTKILNRYKYREIGFETPGRFIDELEIALNEIMPYYNQILYTLDLDYDILHNVDYIKELEIDKTGSNETTGSSVSTGENTSTASDESNTTANVEHYNKNVKSDTPQDELSITNKDIDDVSYASELGFNHDSSTDTGKTTGNSSTESSTSLTNESNTTGSNVENERHKEITKGNYGQVSYQSLIRQYRDLIANVERDIINDKRIRTLFMQVY